jgi:hypothetical protein
MNLEGATGKKIFVVREIHFSVIHHIFSSNIK